MLSPSEEVEDQLCRLKGGSRVFLRNAWQSCFRKRFPDHLPSYLIVGLIAWQLQADRYGGLTKEEEKYLADIGTRPAELPISRFGEVESRYQTGTVFVREHAGVIHRVTRTAGGYEWQSRKYGSLSAVASAITGTKWNGLRFFGVPISEAKRNGRA